MASTSVNMRVSIAFLRIRSLCSDGAKISQICSVDLCATPPQVVPKCFGASHMHHASAHKKEVVRMTFLFGHRCIHVVRVCLGRALMVVSMFLFFVAGQAIVLVGCGACTNDRH